MSYNINKDDNYFLSSKLIKLLISYSCCLGLHYLQQKGVVNMRTQNYSRKRQAIYDLMLSTQEHPSAEWIYTMLKPEFPDLSLGTVYRNLKLLEENGAIRAVTVISGSEHYDAIMTPHPHFICNLCGKIQDLPAKFLLPELTSVKRIRGVGQIDLTSLIYY